MDTSSSFRTDMLDFMRGDGSSFQIPTNREYAEFTQDLLTTIWPTLSHLGMKKLSRDKPEEAPFIEEWGDFFEKKRLKLIHPDDHGDVYIAENAKLVLLQGFGLSHKMDLGYLYLDTIDSIVDVLDKGYLRPPHLLIEHLRVIISDYQSSAEMRAKSLQKHLTHLEIIESRFGSLPKDFRLHPW